MQEASSTTVQAQAAGELSGRAALVTGAASGIGLAVAERLVRAGADVLAVDLNPAPDGAGVGHRADLSDPAANVTAVSEALERFGRLDVIVANAGLQHVAPIDEFPLTQWQQMLDVMLTSPFLLAKHAWSALQRSGQGRFIAVASVHSLVASPYKSAYVSAKHGVMGLVKSLALEGAPFGIRATAICPGYVRTPFVEDQIAAQAQAHGIPEERVLEEVILAPQAIRRLIEPGEVADVIAMLAGPLGSAFTGAPVVMDCGFTAR